MQYRSSRRLAVVVALLVLGLVSLAGATAGTVGTRVAPPNPLTSVLAQINGLSIKGGFPNNPRDQKLIQLAQQEGGQVNLYTSISSFITKPLQQSWAATVPQIQLNLYRGASADVTARFLAESAAGTKGADVVESDGTTLLIFQHKRNLLVPYRLSPYAVQIPMQYRFDDFTADRLEMFVVAWNKNLVPTPPTSFAQLADPSWKGKLALEPTDFDWYATMYNYFTNVATPKMTPAAFEAMMTKIAQNAQLIPGHSAEASALASGQVSVIVNGHAQEIEQLQAKGAPISFGPPFVQPVIQRPQGIAISYLTPHPAAALLFYDYMLSPVGQKMLQQNGVFPANPYFADSSFASLGSNYQKMNIRPIVEHYQAWTQQYAQVTGGSG
jgi:iron(III) transport system substrate-binding protein